MVKLHKAAGSGSLDLQRQTTWSGALVWRKMQMTLFDLINQLNAPVGAKDMSAKTAGDAEQFQAVASSLAPVLARRLQAVAKLSAQPFSVVLSQVAAEEAAEALSDPGGADMKRLSAIGAQAMADLMSDSTMQKAAIARLEQQSHVERSQLVKDLPVVTGWILAGLFRLVEVCQDNREAAKADATPWYSGLAERLGWDQSDKQRHRDPIDSVLDGDLNDEELRLFLPQTRLESLTSA